MSLNYDSQCCRREEAAVAKHGFQIITKYKIVFPMLHPKL